MKPNKKRKKYYNIALTEKSNPKKRIFFFFNKVYGFIKQKSLFVPFVILCDILGAGLILIVFALFHHVIPRPAEPLYPTVTMPPIPSVAPQNPGSNTAAIPTSSPEATPTATPAVGDFSLCFDSAVINKNADYVYEDNAIKIAVTKHHSNETNYFIADVYVRNIAYFKTAFAKNTYGVGVSDRPVNIANQQNAVFAVTGDYCGARAEGLVIRNGSLYRNSINSDVCLLYINGVMATYNQHEYNPESLKNAPIWQAWAFGPELMRNGKARSEFKEPIRVKNPRSSIGYYEPGHYCFIVVEGRGMNGSKGLTLSELAKLYESLGCSTAFNLDGGQTAEIIFKGERLNTPESNGRASSDIICFKAGGQ